MAAGLPLRGIGRLTLRIVSWNIAHRIEPWNRLVELGADVALLQEAAKPPPNVEDRISVNPGPWLTAGADADRPWRAAVARLSNRVKVEWIEAKSIEHARYGEFAVSRAGTLAAARVTPAHGEPLVVVSTYAPWTRPHGSTDSGWIVSDASAHRAVSDLSAFIGSERGHRIVAAGDLNILHGHGEHGSAYWAGRYGTVFSRMDALGLSFVGPQAPHGRQADPWPDELPPDSKNVPTYHTNRQTPATATRQLDFVFASKTLAPSVQVSALNEPEQWGPSDHCIVQIDIA